MHGFHNKVNNDVAVGTKLIPEKLIPEKLIPEGLVDDDVTIAWE
jgi:hypothetical protein